VLLTAEKCCLKNTVMKIILPIGANQITYPMEVRVKAGDKISIVINSKDSQLEDLFNLPHATVSEGAT